MSHASNPVAEHIHGDLFRVYYNSRDAENRAALSYFEIDLSEHVKLKRFLNKPLLQPGVKGAFDDQGMSMGCIFKIDGKRHLYYLGWNLGVNVPFTNNIGLAIEDPITGLFERFSEGPIVSRDIHDPLSLSYPFIVKDGDEFIMWYGSHEAWGETTSDMIHSLKRATSKDGKLWTKHDGFCIKADDTDYAFSKPSVIKGDDGIYCMWYCYRGGKYRIGYAESNDGISWTRKDDEVGLTVSDDGWDDDMVCYPNVFEHNGNTYMLYNGNGYGKTGIGMAILD